MTSANRSTGRVLVVLGLVAVLLGMPGTTLAKRQKRTISATVAGKHVNWKGRLVLIHDTEGSGLSVIGTKAFATKTIGVGCGILLAGQTFPLDATACSMNYQARKGRRIRSWINTGLDPSNPVHVTITSFDGTVIQGTFAGTMMSATGDGSTLSVQGTFGGPLGP